MKVIGLCGKRQSGKDTFTNIAMKVLGVHNIPSAKLAFADPLKEFLKTYLGVSDDALNGTNEQKDAPIGKWKDFFSSDFMNLEKDNDINGRKLMQIVGTQVFRKIFGKNIWVDITLRLISEYKRMGIKVLFVPDIRFDSEIRAIKRIGKVVRLYRNTGLEEMDHESEKEMNLFVPEFFDYIVPPEKNVNILTLEQEVLRILEKEKLYDC